MPKNTRTTINTPYIKKAPAGCPAPKGFLISEIDIYSPFAITTATCQSDCYDTCALTPNCKGFYVDDGASNNCWMFGTNGCPGTGLASPDAYCLNSTVCCLNSG